MVVERHASPVARVFNSCEQLSKFERRRHGLKTRATKRHQSTKANSFDCNSTWASFSKGVKGVGGLGAGPANSVEEFHTEPLSSPAVAVGAGSLVRVMVQLKES